MKDQTIQSQNLTSIREITDHIRDINTQALSVIEACTEKQYQYTDKYASIGAHIRHVIEFMKALNNNQQDIDYDARLRDQKIETDQNFAADQLNKETEILLQTLKTQDLTNTVIVTLDGMCTESTFGRELAATLSHTIHHLAFMKLLADQQNIKLDKNIGIAPATLSYQMRIAAE